MRTTWSVSAALIAVLACCCGGPADFDPAGHWEGSIVLPGAELGIAVDFENTDGGLSGTIDIPVQGAFDLDLSAVSSTPDSVLFALVAGPGRASFRGLVIGDSTIMGSFSQGAFEGTFDLRRTAVAEQAPRPFREDSVTINGDGFVLAGTFTVPPGEGPFPAAILLTGSGLQTRDENVFGFEVFRVLADSLAMDGIAVLRFDDRGTGGSTGLNPALTDSMLALDACAMLDLARGLDGVDPARVGFLGHSEGAIVAFMAASMRPEETAFVVSMSGPSVRGYELLVAQIEGLSRMAGQPEEEIAEDVANQILLMDAVIDGTAPAVAESIVRSSLEADLAELTPEQLAVYGDLDAYVETSVSQTMVTLLSPWFRHFITTDPLDYLEGFEAPVLALFGELDVQVPADLDEPPMSGALAGRPGSSVVVFPGANHLFQPAVTGAVEEYQGLPKEFVPGFTSTVSEWILSQGQTPVL